MFTFYQKLFIFSYFCISLFIALPCSQAFTGQTYDNVPALLKGMASKDPDVSRKAYSDAEKLEKSDVPALIRELENKDSTVCAMAVDMLAGLVIDKKLGDTETTVTAILKGLLKSARKVVRHGAAVRLTQIDPSLKKELMPVLIEIVKEGTPEYEGTAVSILCLMGSDAKDAVPVIIESMQRQPQRIRNIYYRQLQFIGTPEALEVGKEFFRKEKLLRMYYKPFYYLARSPLLNVFITLGFVFLFWWSWVQRKKGVQIIYWQLLIPVPFWGLWAVYTITLLSEVGFPFQLISLQFYVQHVLLVVTLAGIIPWLLNLLLWGSPQKTEKIVR